MLGEGKNAKNGENFWLREQDEARVKLSHSKIE